MCEPLGSDPNNATGRVLSAHNQLCALGLLLTGAGGLGRAYGMLGISQGVAMGKARPPELAGETAKCKQKPEVQVFACMQNPSLVPTGSSLTPPWHCCQAEHGQCDSPKQTTDNNNLDHLLLSWFRGQAREMAPRAWSSKTFHAEPQVPPLRSHGSPETKGRCQK